MTESRQLPNDLATLAERLKWARKQKGMRQEDLAKAIGASRAQVQKLENGTITRPRNMEALAMALSVSPVWLQYGDPRLDELTADGTDIALLWQSLPESEQAIARQLIEGLVAKAEGSKQ